MKLTIILQAIPVKGVIQVGKMVAIDGRQVGFYIFFQLQVSTLGYGFQLQSESIIMTYRLTFNWLMQLDDWSYSDWKSGSGGEHHYATIFLENTYENYKNW